VRVSDFGDKVTTIIRALANRLTAEDNWGPEGEKWQVLTSRGPRDVDPPPTFMNIEDILKGISSETPGNGNGLPGIEGPPGPTGPPGPAGDEFGDLDGGVPDSVYGGMFVVDGGGI